MQTFEIMQLLIENRLVFYINIIFQQQFHEAKMLKENKILLKKGLNKILKGLNIIVWYST